MTVDVSELDRAAVALERDRWTIVVREAIRDSLLIRGSVHADNLATLDIPDDHKNCIGGELGRWVRRGLIYEAERRPAAASSSHGRKSGVFRATAKGVTKLTGVGADGTKPAGITPGVRENPLASPDSGEKRYCGQVPPADGEWGLVWDFTGTAPPSYWRRPLTADEKQGQLAA